MLLKSISIHIDYCPLYNPIQLETYDPIINSIRQYFDVGYCTWANSLIMRVFGVLPMVPLVDNICTIGTNGITIFTICTNLFTNGTIGN